MHDNNNDNDQPTKKKEFSNTTKTICLLAFIGVIGIIGIFGYTNISRNTQSVIIDIPQVNSSSMSSSRNEYRNMTTSFSLEFDRRTANRVDKNKLHLEINQVMNSLDSDKITGLNGTDFVKDEVHAHLSTMFTDEELLGVFLTDVFNDGFGPPSRG